MKINIRSIRFNASERLLNHIQEKVDKLDQVFEKIISTDVYLRIDKSADASNKVAEVKVNIPGKKLFASKKCLTFEEAIDSSVDALERQLIRTKEKNTRS